VEVEAGHGPAAAPDTSGLRSQSGESGCCEIAGNGIEFVGVASQGRKQDHRRPFPVDTHLELRHGCFDKTSAAHGAILSPPDELCFDTIPYGSVEDHTGTGCGPFPNGEYREAHGRPDSGGTQCALPEQWPAAIPRPSIVSESVLPKHISENLMDPDHVHAMCTQLWPTPR